MRKSPCQGLHFVCYEPRRCILGGAQLCGTCSVRSMPMTNPEPCAELPGRIRRHFRRDHANSIHKNIQIVAVLLELVWVCRS